jgi:hypothetical protein
MMYFLELNEIDTKEAGEFARGWLIRHIDNPNESVPDVCKQFHKYWEVCS